MSRSPAPPAGGAREPADPHRPGGAQHRHQLPALRRHRGGVSAAGEFLREKVEKYFTKYAFSTVRNSSKIKLAVLGNDAGIIGAASLALKFKGE